VSLSIEEELNAIAEMMAASVNVGDPISEVQEDLEGEIVADDMDSILDNYLPRDFTDRINLHRFSLQSHATSNSSQYTGPALTIDSSLSPESDFDPADDYCDSAYLSPRSPYPAFHLPRASTPHDWDLESPSLQSSVSNSSFSTPSLSRTSSFQHTATAPASPVIPSAYSPFSYSWPIDPPSPSPQTLDVIQERRDSEDYEADLILPIMDIDGRIASRSSFEDHDQKSHFDVDLEVIQHRTVRANNVIWERRGIPEHHERLRIQTAMPELERMRIKAVTPDTITPDHRGPLSPDSPATSTDGSSIRSPRQGGGPISRLFQKNPKTPKSPARFTKSMEALPNLSTVDPRAAKAEEKQRKKELAKLRRERLNRELDEKARKEAAAEMKRRTHKVNERVMFGGMNLGYVQGL